MPLDITKILASTSTNMQKIVLNDSTTVSVPVSTGFPLSYDATTISHGLGYIPTARVFYEPISGELWPLSPNQYSNADGGPGTTLDIYGRCYLTTTDLVIELANVSGSPVNVPLYWRVYADS